MSIYYEITPLDTLFFRGAEPMEAGQLTGTSLFPPPVSVLSGAMRTAVLKQKNINFAEYNRGSVPAEIVTLIGKSGQKAPFDVTAVLLKKDGSVYAPAPFSWFVDSGKKFETGKDCIGKAVLPAFSMKKETALALGIVSSSESLPLVSAKEEAVTLGGSWIRLELLGRKGSIQIADGDILTSKELYSVENRTGISLLDRETDRPSRKVRDGALFSAAHIRLHNGVSMIAGISSSCGLSDTGVLHLGGEQRISGYSKIDISLPSVEGGLFSSLSPVELNDDVLKKVFCSGKPVMTAGWDLHKKFHKSSSSWLPAGSVFIENINNQCVQIAQK